MSELDNMMMDYDDVIEEDGEGFVVFPAGEYPFVVTNMTRGALESATAKLPVGCRYVDLDLEVTGPEGKKSTIKERLFLYKTLEWKLSQFFRCIGQKKHGEKLIMKWGSVVGSKGHCKLIVNKYKKDGNDRENNKVDSYLDPGDWKEVNDKDNPFTGNKYGGY